MSWRLDFQRASFRGVAFETDSRDLSGGRRIVNHIYPKRDEPNPEDMGLSPHSIEVDAYLFGPNYLGPRNSLIAALEQQGAGEYVDAWGASHTVVVAAWSCREREGRGGCAEFRISFLEAGTRRGHMAVPDTAGRLTSIAEAFRNSAILRFTRNWLPISGNPEALFMRVVKELTEYLGVGGLIGDVTGVYLLGQRLISLFVSGGAGARPVMTAGTMGATGQTTAASVLWAHSGNLAASPEATAQTLAILVGYAPGGPKERVARHLELAERALSGDLAGNGGSMVEPADIANAEAAHNLLACLALAEAATAMAETEFVTAQEARDTGFAVATGLGALRAYADARDYRELTEFRAALVADTHTRAARLPELVSVPTGRSMPALVYAYKLYGTAAKAAELLRLNPSITHPGFVPGDSAVVMLRRRA